MSYLQKTLESYVNFIYRKEKNNFDYTEHKHIVKWYAIIQNVLEINVLFRMFSDF